MKPPGTVPCLEPHTPAGAEQCETGTLYRLKRGICTGWQENWHLYKRRKRCSIPVPPVGLGAGAAVVSGKAASCCRGLLEVPSCNKRSGISAKPITMLTVMRTSARSQRRMMLHLTVYSHCFIALLAREPQASCVIRKLRTLHARNTSRDTHKVLVVGSLPCFQLRCT